MRRVVLFVSITGLAWCVSSCFQNRDRPAIIWTDRPEFAFYAEYFNASQNRYRVEIRYFDALPQKLKESNDHPDIAIGSWLKNASIRVYFKALDEYFSGDLSKSAFYSRLLAMGQHEGRQYLLPVSFNAPALIFARDKGAQLSNPFTVGFSEIKKLGREYNQENGGVYTRMGFSPAWDDDFLFIIAVLLNASFRDAAPLAWDSAALDRALDFVHEWMLEVNSGVQAEEDFTFKYFVDPMVKLAISGRILFTYMDSDDFFTQPEEQRNSLDFRWLAERDAIPLSEDSVYLGITRKGKSRGASAAFVKWFFHAETQRLLLEKNRENRMLETSFGIGGGFSALRPVTEQVFPHFYPGLLGHMPPADFLSPENIFPGNWPLLKERIVLPYLHDRARTSNPDEVYPLEKRLADWLKVNRS
jgi:ABC-type glycerol-3-phosphate transport system substrate-binding protein